MIFIRKVDMSARIRQYAGQTFPFFSPDGLLHVAAIVFSGIIGCVGFFAAFGLRLLLQWACRLIRPTSTQMQVALREWNFDAVLGQLGIESP